jgi:trimeric autotransporter adhesin
MKKSFYLSALLFCGLIFGSLGAGASTLVVTSNPSNQTICSTLDSVWFIVKAIDTPGTHTINYKWQVSTDGGTTWTNAAAGSTYSGVTNDSLKVHTSVGLSSYQYRCVVSDSSSSVNSSAATLLVETLGAGTISGASAVCVGSSVALSDGVSGGTWSLSNAMATISGSGLITGVAAGVDTVTYTSTNICGTATATYIVTVNPLPSIDAIVGASSACKGSVDALTDAVSGGVWSVSNPAVGSIDGSGNVTAIMQGFDTASYTTTTGLCSAMVSFPVRVDTSVVALPLSGPTLTCVGHFVHLSNDNVLGTWIWSVSNAVASVNTAGDVTGAAYGTDTVTYTFTNACNTVASSYAVSVDTPLDAGSISGATDLCSGSSTSLTETVSGGIWLSSNSDIAVVDGSGTVTGTGTGSVTISYLRSNGCGATVATHTMTISGYAGPIVGFDSVGIGSHLTLSDTVSGGSWSSSDVSIATVSSAGVVTGLDTGYTVITYTVTNFCGTSYSTMVVNVGPHPFAAAISGNDSVCIGSSITLADATSGGVWVSGNPSIATVTTGGVVTGVSAGTAHISYVVVTGFDSTVVTKTVKVKQLPTVLVSGPNILAIGGSYELFGYPSGGVWSQLSYTTVGTLIGTVGYSTTDTIVHDSVKYTPLTFGYLVVTTGGTNTFVYTLTTFCGVVRDSLSYTLSYTGSGVPQVTGDVSSMSLFPNPNHGHFTFRINADNSEKVAVVITDVAGRVVKNIDAMTNNDQDAELDVPTGVYMLQATTANGTYSAKINVTR